MVPAKPGGSTDRRASFMFVTRMADDALVYDGNQGGDVLPTRHTGPTFTGVAHASPYPTSRLAPVHDLVDAAAEIARADAMLGAVAHGKLAVIVEQIRSLQEQARRILEVAQQDAALHRAVCRFRKRPGAVYHAYDGPDGWYLSMLSPTEWGEPPHPFVGSYELLVDMSWRRVDVPAP